MPNNVFSGPFNITSGAPAATVENIAALKALTSRPESVLVKAGQAAGVWQWVSGSSTTADDGTVVTPTTGPAGRYKRVYDGPVDVRWFGAVGGCTILLPSTTTYSITSGSPTLTAAGASFTAADVGKQIRVPFAGVAGALLQTTIAARISATQVTLAANASATVTSERNVIVYGVDDTAAFTAALAGYSQVYVPPGHYFLTSALTVRNSCRLFGGAKELTALVRTDPYGNTVTMGVPGTTAAGSAVVSGLHFLEPQYFASGVTTRLPFVATANAAHVAIHGGQLGGVQDCMFSYMPHGIKLYGCSTSTIEGNHFTGIWDRANSALQEGISHVYVENDATFGGVKDLRIVRNDFSGFAANRVHKFITDDHVGPAGIDKTLSVGYGTKHGIWLRDCEDGEITGSNYFGGLSMESILLDNSHIMAGVGISNNFIDASAPDKYAIRLTSTDAAYYAMNISVSDNKCIGQYCGLGVFQADNPGWPVAYGVDVSDNTMLHWVGAPISNKSARAFSASGNIIGNYNCLNVGPTDPEYGAGLYVGPVSVDLPCTSSSGNTWGGGGNLLDATSDNYCSWGIYADTTPNMVTWAAETSIGVNTGIYGGASSATPTISGGMTFDGPVVVGYETTLDRSLYLRSSSAAPAGMGFYNLSGTTFRFLGGSAGYDWRNAANSASLMTLSDSGDFTLGGANVRFQADMSNATIADRFAFQNSVSNAATRLMVLPNGTSAISAFNLVNNSDPTNASWLTMNISGSGANFATTTSGSGTQLPLGIGAFGANRLQIENGSVRILTGNQLWLGNAYAGGAPTPTGYLTLYDVGGVAYKVPAEAA